ncbi:hypothetical protein LCGC14_0543270 [marine sediment metagenome]|uniref:Zinc-ribbon domain-containing protein n=1 Tax=marine sediment metagenome TaxID=412755 RepID=A0A0F9UDK6_9ZZZZ|nr:MAG: hypothetical protein Lokiarch_36030 [Candidatus Lokiarchaeum sp. GC14_75]
MDLSSIFAYILKIAILLMNSHIEIPDEIDEKLKKNHNLLSRQIRKTQTFLILQQMFRLISISSLIFLLILIVSLRFSIIFLFFALPPFIGVVSFFLYIIFRFIKETIVIRREYFLKEKQNLNYLSEEILMMIKIYTTKFRIFKLFKMRDPLFQDNRVSMDVKMGLILKHEKHSVLNDLFWIIILLFQAIFFSDFRIWYGFFSISFVLLIIPSYLVLKQTNKWMNGYHELNAWGDLLDKYEIIPKHRYMALLDKDFNNLERSSNEYCGKCGEFSEPNAQFCRFCGQRKESN